MHTSGYDTAVAHTKGCCDHVFDQGALCGLLSITLVLEKCTLGTASELTHVPIEQWLSYVFSLQCSLHVMSIFVWLLNTYCFCMTEYCMWDWKSQIAEFLDTNSRVVPSTCGSI